MIRLLLAAILACLPISHASAQSERQERADFERLSTDFEASVDRDKVEVFAPHFLAAANRSVGSAAAIPFLLWVLKHAPKHSSEFGAVVSGLSRQHAIDPGLDRVLVFMVQNCLVDDEALQKIGNAVINNSSDRPSLAWARFERGRKGVRDAGENRQARELAEVDLRVALSFAKGTDQAITIRRYIESVDSPVPLVLHDDYKGAIATAKKQGKMVFVNLTGRTCVNCRVIEVKVFVDPWIRKLRGQYVEARLHVDDPNFVKQHAKQQRELGCDASIPAYVVVDPATGRVVQRLTSAVAVLKQPRMLENFFVTNMRGKVPAPQSLPKEPLPKEPQSKDAGKKIGRTTGR